MSKVETKVEQIASQLLKESADNFELVDVEYVKERDWYLRIFIDKEGGIGIEDCQKFSEMLSKVLDEQDIIPTAYNLEISSPGLDRVLKKDRDFIRERGKKVDVALYSPINKQKNITGVLIDRSSEVLNLEGLDPIPLDKIAQVRLHIDF